MIRKSIKFFINFLAMIQIAIAGIVVLAIVGLMALMEFLLEGKNNEQ